MLGRIVLKISMSLGLRLQMSQMEWRIQILAGGHLRASLDTVTPSIFHKAKNKKTSLPRQNQCAKKLQGDKATYDEDWEPHQNILKNQSANCSRNGGNKTYEQQGMEESEAKN